MKKLTKKYSVQLAGLLLLLTLLPVSCIKDDYTPKGTATVTMTFTTRAISNPTASAGGLEANEHMRTLRVIVARTSGEILYNLKYDIDENETSKTITFSEMTVEKDGEDFDFYAIANEGGVGYTDKSWDNVSVDDLKGMTLQTAFLTAANDSEGSKVIPQTAYKEITVRPQAGGGIQTETMTLDFAVAKVRLTIENTSTDQQTVSGISLSGVDMTSTPLFAGENLSTEAEGTVSLGEMTIPAESNGTPGKSTVYAYFFENQNSEGYTLTAFWKKYQTLPLQTGSDDNKQPITEIPRGKMLDINVTLNADVDINPTIQVQVNEWIGKTINVPPFE